MSSCLWNAPQWLINKVYNTYYNVVWITARKSLLPKCSCPERLYGQGIISLIRTRACHCHEHLSTIIKYATKSVMTTNNLDC